MADLSFNWDRDYRGNLKWLHERTFFLTVHGSHAYGTSLPESDVDIRGIAVAPRSYYTSFTKSFEQSETKDPDLVIFEVKKFFQLAAVANPNALEIIFTRNQEHLIVSPAAEKLLANRDLFLSRRAKHTLSGYAISQLKRIKTHRRWLQDPPKGAPTRAEYGLPERTVIPADQLAAARAAVQKQLDRWAFKDMEDLTPPTRQHIMDGFQNALAEMTAWAWHEADGKKFQAAANVLGYSTNFIELLDIERKYEAAKKNWQSFLKWRKDRNPSRAALEEKFGYDCKHGMHLVRLMWTARDLFLTGKYNVYRDDREALLSIRQGHWSYEQLIEFAERMDKELTILMEQSPLPWAVDVDKLDALFAEIVEMML